MEGTIHHSGRWRLALVIVAGGLTAACSTYQPLNRGSDVPWAKESRMAAAASAEAGAMAPAAAQLPQDRYTVRRGDRLASLAARYGVSVEALGAANRLRAPYVIYVGQVLWIPRDAQDPAAAAAQAVTFGDVPTADLEGVQVAELTDQQGVALNDARDTALDDGAVAGDQPAAAQTDDDGLYVVRRGETLWSISRRVKMSMVELAAENRIGPPYEVLAGQRLRIPESERRTTQMVTVRKVGGHRIATGEPPALTGQGFLWPVNGKVIGSFGRTKQGQRRDGIDIAARQGAPVLAAEDGIVAYAGDGIHGYGRLILLRHGDGYITTYAHNAALLVEVGELVERGQVIARVGSTGNVSRSLLHFELRKGRKPIDPATVLVRDGTTVASTE